MQFNILNGIYPLTKKSKSIKDLPMPKMHKEVRQMLGLTGYFQKFIPAYADLE